MFVVAEDVFFVIQSGFLVAWNCRTHEQFELSDDYKDALLRPTLDASNPLIAELRAAGLLRHQSDAWTPWGWDRLSRIFHIGTSAHRPEEFNAAPIEQAEKYLEYCGSITNDMPVEAFSYRRGKEIVSNSRLNRDEPEVLNLLKLLAERKTNRTFSKEPVSLPSVASIVAETFRYRDHDADAFSNRGLATPTRRRSSPSGGSLQSCEAYLLAKSVDGLEPGVYHYWSDKDAFGYLGPLLENLSFGELAAGQMLADELAAMVIVTCRFDKLAWKYPHSRAYRVALLDAGHLSQTFQLLATAEGLRTWLTGMFFDWDIRKLLQLDDESQEYPLLLLGLGNGPYCPFDRYIGTT